MRFIAPTKILAPKSPEILSKSRFIIHAYHIIVMFLEPYLSTMTQEEDFNHVLKKQEHNIT